MTREAIHSTLIDSLMRVFDDTDDISVIGTGADELCVGRDAVKEMFLRNFSQATANEFEWDWVDTRISNNHAVTCVTFIIHLEYKGNQLEIPLRWTVVLKNENDRWVWLHRHASTAASGQDDGQAYPKGKQEKK